MNPKKFISIFIAVNILILSIYLSIFYMLIGSPVKAEWWLRDVLSAKNYIYNKTSSPRIIVIGGSNALFGIYSKVLEEKLHYPVVNFSSHGEVDLDYFKYQLSKFARKDDIVIMPLEFTFYTKENMFSLWFINNMLAWGKDYILQLNYYQILDFVWHTPVYRLIEGALSYFNSDNKEIKINISKNDIYRYIDLYGGNLNPKWNGYNYTSLNRYGDIFVNRNPTSNLIEMKKEGIDYYDGAPISSYFIKEFREIQNIVKNSGARLYLTWPVTIRNKKFNFSDNYAKNIINKFANNLSKSGIDIYCNPASFNFDYKLFFDTVYHLNYKGAYLRATNLAQCLQYPEDNKFTANEDYTPVVKQVLAQEAALYN